MKIGNIEVGFLALGPMAGVTDMPFRILCKEQGADLIYTEMVSAKGIHYNNTNTKDMLLVDERERPTALQLFGNEPEIMAETAKRIEERNFDIRKHLLEYDDVLNEQRNVIYQQRDAILADENLTERVMTNAKDMVDDIFDDYEAASRHKNDNAKAILIENLNRMQVGSSHAVVAGMLTHELVVVLGIVVFIELIKLYQFDKPVSILRICGITSSLQAPGPPFIISDFQLEETAIALSVYQKSGMVLIGFKY